MIRAIPSNASDNIYCTLLAHSAVHGAMAGYSGFTVGPVNSRHAYIPISVRTFPAKFIFAWCFCLWLMFIVSMPSLILFSSGKLITIELSKIICLKYC